MSSEDRLVHSPATCLSEEAMDLICSFVREFEDDHEMAKTLYALSLTSRRWTSSAVRALYFDPTRSLRRRLPASARWLLATILLKNPGLGASVRELIRLPFHQSGIQAAYQTQVEVWVLTLLRACPNVVAIAISPLGPVNWAEELKRTSRLQHLTIMPTPYEEWTSYDTCGFLARLRLPRLKSLTLDLEVDDWIMRVGNSSKVEVEVDLLVLSNYHFHPALEVPLRPLGLRHLRLQPYRCSECPGWDVLPASLEILEYQPIGARPRPPTHPGRAYGASPDRSVFPYEPLPALPKLRHLALEFIFIDLLFFAAIAAKYPTLQTLSLKDSIWRLEEWEERREPSSDLWAIFEQALASLPSLISLDLGWVPVTTHGALWPIKWACKSRGIKLIFKPSLVPESVHRQRLSAAFSPSSFSSDVTDSEYEYEHVYEDEHVYEYEHVNVDPYAGFPSPSSFPRSDWPLLPPPFLPPTGVPSSSSSSEVGDDSGFFEPLPVLSPTSPPRLQPDLDLDSLFSAVFPFPAMSPSSSLPPSRSPSPAFLPVKPDQPRFEPDYQALDLAEKSQDDFDAADGEEWRRWEGMSEVDEAERAWKAGEGTTYAPIEEVTNDGENEVEARDELDELDELDEAAVEVTIEVWRAVVACAA